VPGTSPTRSLGVVGALASLVPANRRPPPAALLDEAVEEPVEQTA
jgi:hypothetical protein